MDYEDFLAMSEDEIKRYCLSARSLIPTLRHDDIVVALVAVQKAIYTTPELVRWWYALPQDEELNDAILEVSAEALQDAMEADCVLNHTQPAFGYIAARWVEWGWEPPVNENGMVMYDPEPTITGGVFWDDMS